MTLTPATEQETGYWPEGVPRHLDYPAVSVGELLGGVCRRFAEHVALEDGEERLTFGELLAEAAALAHALRADGVGPGDTVLMHLPNSRWFVVGYVGVQLAGATLSPANPLYPADGLRHQLQEAGAVVAISHPEHVGTLLAARAGTALRRVVVVPGTAAAPATTPVPEDDVVVPVATYVDGQPTDPPARAATSEDVAHLAFTGGTTGVSKGVRVLNRNVVANVCQAVAWRGGKTIAMTGGELTVTSLGRDDIGLHEGRGVTIMAGPMYHAQALINTLFMLTTGARIVILGRFSPAQMLALIEARGATYINGSPTMWHALLNCPDARERDLSSLQVVSSGAAPIDLETMRALRSIFPAAMLNEGYGLTEGTCLVSAAPGFHGARRKLGSVGQPVPDTEIEIRDAEGRVLPAGETGELWVRGPQVTAGYHGHDELTAEQYVDGWLRTGDVGRVDEEGFVFISDRLKDMLIYKGYNVYPRELEELLVQHPAIDAAAVVGRDDPAVGQLPVAFVVARPGATVSAEELIGWVADQVLPYKKIREVHVLPALPANPAGKILKTELRAQLT